MDDEGGGEEKEWEEVFWALAMSEWPTISSPLWRIIEILFQFRS